MRCRTLVVTRNKKQKVLASDIQALTTLDFWLPQRAATAKNLVKSYKYFLRKLKMNMVRGNIKEKRCSSSKQTQ
ncbi:hypothetical protein QVD17_09355 [Tagetes erecta]|uniref:Uncharacterized protein n=1 Tax=Tagetes erecta TaxID=13708 RepID=A0AAD8L3Q6_TARER|nr:hypothetical protein QVD17_09355 [Tagetes erecta]